MTVPPLPSSDALECRIRVDLFVFDEFDGSQTIGIENVRELLDGGRFSVNSICLRIPPDEDVYEACWTFGVLPYLVSKRPGLILADIRHKLMDRIETLFECLRSNLVAGKLVYLG